MMTPFAKAFGVSTNPGQSQYADTSMHRYIVYDRMVRTGFDKEGHSLSQMTQGLLVRSGGRTVSSRHCTYPVGAVPPAFDQRQIEVLLPQGKYVPH